MDVIGVENVLQRPDKKKEKKVVVFNWCYSTSPPAATLARRRQSLFEGSLSW